jgi:hypothetical protein
MLVVIVLGIDTLPYKVLLCSSSSSLISSLLSSTTLSSSTPITCCMLFFILYYKCIKGGGSKRGFLHLLSSFLVKYPIYFPTYSHTRPFTIAKASSSSCRGSSPSSPTSMPLLCASSSSEVATSLNSQWDHTFIFSDPTTTSSGIFIGYPTPNHVLFYDISPSWLLSSTTLSPTHPPSVVSFLFILGLTPCLSPLSTFFVNPLLYFPP